MILVDTSVWIVVLSRNPPFRLEDVVDFRDVVICPPVLQEILHGIRVEAHFRRARTAMSNLPIVEAPMQLDVFVEAAGIYRQARGVGWTVRSSVDCLIATCALRHDLEVLHRDRDFPVIARVTPLRERSI